MSGRSAYVRKKITETNKGKGPSTAPGSGRTKSTASSEDNATVSDFPVASPTLMSINRADSGMTGVPTTNARFLKFSEPVARDHEALNYRTDMMGALAAAENGSGGSSSQSGGSSDGRRDNSAGGPNQPAAFRGPLEDFAYARARRPVIKTEDVSGIEKSGLRNIFDKKSDEVRKGLVKTFTFGSKKKDRDQQDNNKRGADAAIDFRPQSAATVRAGQPPQATAGGGGIMSGGGNSSHYPTSDPDAGYDLQFEAANDDSEGGAFSPPGTSPFPSGRPGGQQFQNQHQHALLQQQNAAAHQQQWELDGGMGAASPPPVAKLPPVPATATPPIRRWIGAGRPVQRWNKLRKDPELWDPNGDVLIFFGHKGQQPRPNPSFRLSSHIIEATESRFLITLLREGSTDDDDVSIAPGPLGAPPMIQRRGAPFASGRAANNYNLGGAGAGLGRGGQPTPPVSEDASLGEADGQISYEMYFPTPANTNRIDQLRHHITTRNVFALLYHASLVGLSLYQALSDLHGRLDAYMPPEADNVGTILNYLTARGIDDVRGDAETAVSLLAWSEGADVRWEEGWRESFLHCAGMYGRLEGCSDFKSVTPLTRALLERACLETQLRVQAAEERLADFQYGDMWPPAVAITASSSGPVGTSPAKAAADRLQKLLISHYTRIYGRWPPFPPLSPTGHDQYAIGTAHGDGNEEDIWLTRTVAQALQKDFAALYDYLVNREVVWDESEARSSRKWMMVHEGDSRFEADAPELPMTDMLIEFDNRLRFPHIPHPYPLVPESIPPVSSPKDSGSNNGSMFGKGLSKKPSTSGRGIGSSRGEGNAGMGTGSSISNNNNPRSGALERRIQLAYTEATNICILGPEFTHSDLVDVFTKFEKIDCVGEVDPSTARRGRWVLIYGVLQTIASVSVDAPNVRYREGVAYHLSPRLKGAKMPPWKNGSSSHNLVSNSQTMTVGPEEAAHELSHCWVVAQTWDASPGNSGAESSAESEISSAITRSYSFPRPPAAGSTATTGGRSSAAGYHTPAGATSRSVRSSRAPSVNSNPAAPFSAAGSVISESDAGSSSYRPSRKGRSRDNLRATAGGMASPSRGIDRVDEHGWPAAQSNPGTKYYPHARGQAPPPAPLSAVAAASPTSAGSYPRPDDQMSFMTAHTTGSDSKVASLLGMDKRSGRSSNYGRPILGGGTSGSETDRDSVAPVIRDFDDLDVVDDHSP